MPLPVSSGKSKISAKHWGGGLDRDWHGHFLTVHQPGDRYILDGRCGDIVWHSAR